MLSETLSGHGTLVLVLPRRGLSSELQPQAQELEFRALYRRSSGAISFMTFKVSHLCISLPFLVKLVSPCT